MKELTLEQMETTQGGKFWGTGDCYPSGPPEIIELSQGGLECRQEWTCTYYAFWIPMYDYPVTGGCVW